MTFEQWFEKEYGPQGINLGVTDLMDEYENYPATYKVRELMKEAWDARYNTLTYHDL